MVLGTFFSRSNLRCDLFTYCYSEVEGGRCANHFFITPIVVLPVNLLVYKEITLTIYFLV